MHTAEVLELYETFNFSAYEAPLSRIARLTGVKLEEVERIVGVSQLVKDNHETNVMALLFHTEHNYTEEDTSEAVETFDINGFRG